MTDLSPTSAAPARPAAPAVDRLAPWLALLGFLAAVAILLPFKGFPGPWVPVYDDGAWVAIVRHWCEGARLYTEVIDLKPPGFFLYLRPLCWVTPQPGLRVQTEVYFFWAPILALYAAGVVLVARSRALRLERFTAAIFGLFAGALAFTNRTESLFSTENPAGALAFLACALTVHARGLPLERRRWHALLVTLAVTAAALVNTKFVAFAPLYFAVGELSLRPFSWKAFGTRALVVDAVAAVALAALVVLVTIGPDPETFRWLARVSQNYWSAGFDTRLQDLVLTGFLHAKNGVFAPFQLLLIGTPGLRQLTYDWLAGSLFLLIPFFLWRRARYLLAPYLLSLWSVVAVGSVWPHTLIQIFPVLIVAVAHFLAPDRPRLRLRLAAPAAAMALVTLSLAYDGFDFGQTMDERVNYFRDSSGPGLIREARILANKFKEHVGRRPWISILTNGMPLWLTQGAQRPLNVKYHNYCWSWPEWAQEDLEKQIARGEPFALVIHDHLAAKTCKTHEALASVESFCVPQEIVKSSLWSFIRFYSCDPRKRTPPDTARLEANEDDTSG